MICYSESPLAKHLFNTIFPLGALQFKPYRQRNPLYINPLLIRWGG